MNNYIAFLLVIFVMAGVAPKLMKQPWVLVLLCMLLCLSFYSSRLF